MPTRRVGIPNGLLLVLGGIVPFLIYRVTIGDAPLWLVGAIVVAQLAAIASWLARNVMVQYRAIFAVVGVTGVAAAVLGLGLPARSVALAAGGVCHGAAYAVLLTWFARSLRPDREPVVTGLARQMRRTMPDKVVRYTRRVTIAWCVFFATQLGVSAGLLAATPEVVWSAFVNLWNLPLVVAMMLAEFGCRLFLFWREPHTGLVATMAGLRRIGGQPTRFP
jgi:uncharacterized membrane protein